MNLQKIRGVGTQYLNCCEKWVRYTVLISEGLPFVYIDTNENVIHNNKKLHKLAISEIINNLTEDLE